MYRTKEERWTASELLADPFLEKKQSRPRNLPRAVVEEEPEAPRPQVAEDESSELTGLILTRLQIIRPW